MKRVRREFFLTILVATLFSGFVLAHDDRSRGTKDAAYRAGLDQGYEDGFRHGQDDYRKGVGYDPNSDEFKRGDRGYDKSVKHKGDYKKGYREGYQNGYREGYERRGGSRRASSRYPDQYPDRGRRYPGGSGRYNTAFDMGTEQGYRDGVEKGEEDYEKNRDPDVFRHSRYRDADRGYKSSYGDKGDYQRGYREGFEDGYRQSFNGSRSGRTRISRGGSIWDRIAGRP